MSASPPMIRPWLALRDAARAAYCQMYYWGRDVMHPDGNLLERYGFQRVPKTAREGASRYRVLWRKGLLELYGFCAGWYPDGGPGICFDRQHEAWRLWLPEDPPSPAALLDGRNVLTDFGDDPGMLLDRSALFVGWMARYERWALAQWGLKARRQHHRDFTALLSRRRWLPPGTSLDWMESYAGNPLHTPRPRQMTASPSLSCFPAKGCN